MQQKRSEPNLPAYLDSDTIKRNIKDLTGRDLTDEESAEVDLWRKGRDIGALVSHPGWQTVLEMIQSYATDAVRSALNVQPGDNDRAIAAHAVMYTMNDFYMKFLQDVKAAVDAAKVTPQVLRSTLRGGSLAPPEALF